MDPAIYAMLAGVAPTAAEWLLGGVAVASAFQAVHGHNRGDYGGLLWTVVGGTLGSGIVYTSPTWVSWASSVVLPLLKFHS